MADPISALGLVQQIGSLVKALYDYSNNVKKAQADLLAICGELTALKSALELFPRYALEDHVGPDFTKMLATTQVLVYEIAQLTTPKQSTAGLAIQSLSWPFNSVAVQDKISRLERLKTWFLMAFALENRMNSQALSESMEEIANMMQQQSKWNQSKEEDQAYDQLLALLAPESPASTHANACRPWQGTETGSWFVDGEFKVWLEDTSRHDRLMVLTGRSGSGKTTLMSRAIEATRQFCEQNPEVYTAYFYCAYNRDSFRQSRNALGSWVAQLASADRSILDELPAKPQWAEAIEVEQLENCIARLGRKGRVILLLDAINESVDGSDLVSSIQRLIASSAQVRILVSTTPHYMAIHGVVNDSACSVNMLPQCVQQDITIYINNQIASHRVLSRIPSDEIVQALLSQSEGVFRWVDCQMGFLTSQLTPNAVRKALKSLPETLEGTYVLMLERIPTSHKALVKEVLMWLSFCQRPLLLEELCEAAFFEEDQSNIDDDDRIEDPEELLAMCQGLAQIDPATSAVALAHSSVKTFLTGEYVRSSKAAYFALDEEQCLLAIVRRCVSYLLMEPFRSGCDFQWRDSARRAHINSMMLRYRFLDYVCALWAMHARSCKLTEAEVELIRRFFDSQRRPGGGNFAFWICCFLPQYPMGALQQTQPLYYAASFGLTSVVKLLLENDLVSTSPQSSGWYIDHKGGRNRSTALQVACWRGYANVVRMLLAAGADPASIDKSGMSCLAGARFRGHQGIVELLREAGASDGHGSARVSRGHHFYKAHHSADGDLTLESLAAEKSPLL